jgi:hypothetical protein
MGRAVQGWVRLSALTLALTLPSTAVQAQALAPSPSPMGVPQPAMSQQDTSPSQSSGIPLGKVETDRLPGSIAGVGGMSSATDRPINSGNGSQVDPEYVVLPLETYVSFIDSAVPVTQSRLLFDADYDDRRPTRNNYYFPKSGTPGSPGWQSVEDRVDWQQLTGYFEFAYDHVFSGFMELPAKWINPDINQNNFGLGDINLGAKATIVQSAGMWAALQLRATIPTRAGAGLSADQYSVEPGLLCLLKPINWLTIESELRYWVPIGGSDYAGDYIRYGVGVSFLERSYTDFWFTPVFEFISWSILNGKELVPLPDGSGVRNTGGQEIVNAIAGIRFGFGDNGDIYTGVGHSVTGDAWMEYFWRVEFRIRF